MGILFSTAVKAVVAVAKLVILGIFPLTSFILALRAEVVAKLVILDISFLNSFILALRVVLVYQVKYQLEYQVFYLQYFFLRIIYILLATSFLLHHLNQ